MIGGWLLWPGLLLVGLLSGLFAGMYGVGAGFLTTPLLHIVFGMPLPLAVGTGLCQSLGAASAAAIRLTRQGQGEPAVSWMMLGGLLTGTYFGVRATEAASAAAPVATPMGSRLPIDLIVQPLYVLLLLFLAWSFIRQPRPDAKPDRRVQPPAGIRRLPPICAVPGRTISEVSLPLLAWSGLAVGFLSSLLGMGGGILLLPLFIHGLGLSLQQAAATSLMVLLPSMMSGVFMHALNGNVDLVPASVLLMTSTMAAPVGASLHRRLTERAAIRLFGAVLIGLALFMVLDLLTGWSQ